MAVPKFNEFMKPLLETIRDGKNYRLKDIRDIIAQRFSLTVEDLNLMLPSGTQTVFANRIQWAGTYLHKAGLVKKYLVACYVSRMKEIKF